MINTYTHCREAEAAAAAAEAERQRAEEEELRRAEEERAAKEAEKRELRRLERKFNVRLLGRVEVARPDKASGILLKSGALQSDVTVYSIVYCNEMCDGSM